jgi:hypothetical protein
VQPLLDEIRKYDKSAVVAFYGSSIQGFRRVKKPGKSFWFDESSDYDIAICSAKLYYKAKRKYPRDMYTKLGKTSIISNDIKDSELNFHHKLGNWPRSVGYHIFKNIFYVVDRRLPTLFIQVDDNGIMSGTYLIGLDVVNNRKIGNRKVLLEKYGEAPRKPMRHI